MRRPRDSSKWSRIRLFFAAAVVPLAIGASKPAAPPTGTRPGGVLSLARQIGTCAAIGCSGGRYYCGYCVGGSCYSCDGISWPR